MSCGAPPGKARQLIAEQVMAAIKELSGQEYVHMYASDRKAELAAAAAPQTQAAPLPLTRSHATPAHCPSPTPAHPRRKPPPLDPPPAKP